MKTRIKIILVIVAAMLALTALALTAFAATSDGTSTASSDSDFLYKSGGVSTYAPQGMTLAEVIAAADANSEIKFLDDVFVYTPSDSVYAKISKGLTFDLDGHTLYFSQSHKTYSFLNVSTTSPVTLKNGTVFWNINKEYVANCSTATATVTEEHCSNTLFNANSNNATINIEGIKAYGSVLVYSYSNTGITVNITGGECHVCESADLFGPGLVDLRANATLNVTDTLIDLTMSDLPTLFTLASYKEKGATVKSTANFTNCTVIGKSSTSNLLKNMNGHTTITFGGCKLFGSLTPAKHKNDTCASPSPVANSIFLRDGTLITSDGYAASNQSLLTLGENQVIKNVSSAYSTKIKTTNSSIYAITNGTDASQINVTYSTTTFSTVFDLEAKDPTKKFTVTFYKHDGITPYIVMEANDGQTITPPSYTLDGTNNGWYTVGFDGWSKTFGSSEKITDFTITSDVAFYPAETAIDSAVIPDLSGAQYNLSFTGSITLNLYLPKAPESVTNVKVIANGNVISGKEISTTQGNVKAYYKLYEIANLSPTKIAQSTDVTINFKVNGVSYSKTLSLSPIGYAEKILNDSKNQTPVWPEETHSMMADMLKYSNELSNAAGLGYVERISTLLETYGRLCTPTYASDGFAELSTSMYALNGYVTSVQFSISEFKPQWIINLDTAKRVTDVSISVDGFYPVAEADGTNFGAITYGLDETKTVKSGSYIKTAYIVNMPIYNMDGDITITLTLSGGTKKTATYNLATYYSGMSASGDELYKWREFLQAFRAFASSSSSYKYSTKVVDGSTATKDFFDCDHQNAKTKSINLTSGRLCNTCNTYIFFYDDFISHGGKGGAIYSSRDAALSGKSNTYSSIDYCHMNANSRASAGYKVGCVATPGAVYYLGYPSDYYGKVEEITISTNTQWDGAHIISDESMINSNETAFGKNLFTVRGTSIKVNGKSYSQSGTRVTSYFSSDIKAGTTKLPFAPGAPMMLYLHDGSVKHYIRNGANQNNGANQTEVILIDEFGNVSNTTPIEWDYTYTTAKMCTIGCTYTDTNSDSKCDTCAKALSDIFYVTAYNVIDEHIKISGLDNNGNISATFENIVNNSVIATSYKTCARGMTIRRSNVTVEGIHHEFTEDNTNLTPRQAYSGFVAYLGNNITFKDMSVWQHMNHYVQNSNGTNTTNLLGSYEFSSTDAINVSWVNCKVRNFFNSDGSLTYRGLFGTNRSRNMYLRDCLLTSFDAHSGAGNVTIENSTFEHINFIGAGEIRLNNVTVYQSTGGAAAIILRQDYGSRWRGNVYFDGLELRYDPQNYTSSYIDLIKVYYTNWNFGYGSAKGSNERPENIYVNNASIMEYSRKAYNNSTITFDENGKVKESTLKVGSKKLGIYALFNSQLSSNTIDYSTVNSSNKNPMGCTKNIYITNSNVQIQYPTRKFFKDMNIYIDGVKQSWY